MRDATLGAKRDRFALEYLAALGAALALYLVTVAPGVLWQDSGMAQVRALERDLRGDSGLALAHPLFYVAAIAFEALPGEPAYNTNLVSAVFGALTIANAYLLMRLLTRYRAAAVTGALSLSVSHAFWFHCTTAEVYTLTTALLGAELLLLYRYSVSKQSTWLVLAYLANGLNFSNHNLALLALACYGVLTLRWLWRGELSATAFAAALAAWVAGAGLYLGLALNEVFAGVPLATAFKSALVGEYGGSVMRLLPSVRLLINGLLCLILDFPTPIALVAFLGVWVAARRRTAFHTGLLVIAFMHVYWGLRYDVPDQFAFFTVSTVLIAVLIAIGADRIFDRAWWWSRPFAALALLPILFYAALPEIVDRYDLSVGSHRDVPYRHKVRYFLHPWKIGYRGGDRFAQQVLKVLPPESVVIADSTTIRPLRYYELRGQWRDDLRILGLQDHDLLHAPLDEPWFTAALERGRVFVVTPELHYAPYWMLSGGFTFEPRGPVYLVVPPPPGDAWEADRRRSA